VGNLTQKLWSLLSQPTRLYHLPPAYLLSSICYALACSFYNFVMFVDFHMDLFLLTRCCLIFQQASALLLFNSSDRLSYSEITAQLNLLDEDVVRLLHSLSCAKYKILNKEPNTKTITPTDYFEFNSKFTDKMRRIKV
jgi:hypothetical protein